MRLRSLVHSLPVSLAILRTAALVAPRHQRAGWLSEWTAELWHVFKACNDQSPASSHGQQEITAFCLGAFQDALWLRRNDPEPGLRGGFRLGSLTRHGWFLALFLALIAAGSMLLAYHLPGARKAILPWPYRDAQSLVLISPTGYQSAPFPTIPIAEYRSWTKSTHHLFTGIAFYQPVFSRVKVAPQRTEKLSIAQASDNLFDLLGTTVSSGASDLAKREDAAELILSHAAWLKYFKSNPKIEGRILEVAGRRAVVVGVLQEDFWRLPGRQDAWLLEDEQQLALLPAKSKGFVLAAVRTSTLTNPHDGQWQMLAPDPKGGADRYDCVSLAERSRRTYLLFLFALALACLALPATTSLPLGEYPASSKRLSPGTKFRRWIFLAAKIALILPIAYYGSVDLAHLSRSIDSLWSQYIQLGSSFSGLLSRFAGPCGISESVVLFVCGCLRIPPGWDNPRATFWLGTVRS